VIIVGVTGNIATGKTTVAGFFKELGAYVVDWDELSREVVRPHSKAWKEISKHFGNGVLNADLKINRQKLADIVFSDERELAKLNQIVHPQVIEMDRRTTNAIKNRDPDALIIKDIPLLFEVARPIFVDRVIVVSASEGTQLRRLEEKGIDRSDAQRRIESQLPIEEKVKSADFVIDNDGTLGETSRQVEDLYTLLRKEEETHRKQRIMEGFDGR
jgi:dephospho-CoA kinase